MSRVFGPPCASRPALTVPLLTVLLLAACEVGPDFARPPTEAGAYDSVPVAEATADRAQSLAIGADIPADWWRLFRSQPLSDLVARAIHNNPDLAAARAALNVARDNLAAGQTGLLPTVGGSFSAQREKIPGAAFGGFTPSFTYSLYNASVNVSYTVDVFGGVRRGIESLDAQKEVARFDAEAAYLSLTANTVTAAIQEASAREQIAETQSIIAAQRRILRILQAKFDAGAVSKSLLTQQQATVATAEANLPPLEHQLVVERHLLSTLAGDLPDTAPAATFTLESLTLPPTVPLSLPSRLVERRPDIRAAEANLHAASAAIGVAEANRLPQITLSGSLGSEALEIGKLLTPGGGFWSFGASAMQTLFDAGYLGDREDAARDAYVEAAAQYRSTVLGAFRDVADALHALQSDAETLNAKIAADKAAGQSLSIAQAQLKAGSITPIEVLTAEQVEQQARVSLAQARAQRYADTAALLAALGGGWWNRADSEAVLGHDRPLGDQLLKGLLP